MPIVCLVPPELEQRLLEPLRRHFEDRDVQVLVERRTGERRSGADRRRDDTGPPAGTAERRRVKGTMGRRTGERRAALVPLEPIEAPEIPRRLRRHAAGIAFARRIEPSPEALENRETEQLIIRVQSGEVQAFAEIYGRYFDSVYGYLRIALRDLHEAEDVTQQVFLKVFEKLEGYERRGRPFRNWLFRIARNHAVSHLRAAGRIELQDQDLIDNHRDASDNGDEVQLGSLGWLTDGDLMLFVERLPLPQRQVLVLRYMLDQSNAEVAEILGRSVDDVKTLHHRAVKFLRNRLAAIGHTPARRRGSSYWPVFRQAEVLRHRRFALH